MVLYFCHLRNYNFDIIIKQCMVTFAIFCTMTCISLSNAMFFHPENYKYIIFSDDWLNIFFFFLNNIYYLFSLVSLYGVCTSFSVLIDVAMICLDTFSLISL